MLVSGLYQHWKTNKPVLASNRRFVGPDCVN
jgi:hypothetical protein